MQEAMDRVLGLSADSLGAGQIACRAVAVYVVLLLLLRIVGDRRFNGRHAAFDIILSIILGATLSRAINGSAPFFGTLLAGVVLVALHWLFSALAFHSSQLEKLIKGQSRWLIKGGELNHQMLRQSHITRNDLLSTLRRSGQPGSLSAVQQAALETNGDISFEVADPNQAEALQQQHHVIEVSVADGVQTIRIQLEEH